MTTHGRYSIVRKLAEGGMAEIYLAELEGTQGFKKRVVLKSIRPALYADPQFKRMIVDEALISMRLNHGNIVQVLDLGESASRCFLVLELVDGWTLDQLLKRARAVPFELPPELALFIAAETCRALAYAHTFSLDGKVAGPGQGIIHRDVSPQNILVSEQGDVKLADFGIAKALGTHDNTTAGVVKGKIAFMSPEQTEAANLDARSDLFSLGSVLYLAVTGKLPFEGAKPVTVMAAIQAGEYAPPAKVKKGLHGDIVRVLQKALKVSPKDRYQSAAEMLVALEKVMREALAPVGKTELKRWLDELSLKDQQLPLSRTAPQVVPGAEPDSLSGWVELGDSAIVPPTLPKPVDAMLAMAMNAANPQPLATPAELAPTATPAAAASPAPPAAAVPVASAPPASPPRFTQRLPSARKGPWKRRALTLAAAATLAFASWTLVERRFRTSPPPPAWATQETPAPATVTFQAETRPATEQKGPPGEAAGLTAAPQTSPPASAEVAAATGDALPASSEGSTSAPPASEPPPQGLPVATGGAQDVAGAVPTETAAAEPSSATSDEVERPPETQSETSPTPTATPADTAPVHSIALQSPPRTPSTASDRSKPVGSSVAGASKPASRTSPPPASKAGMVSVLVQSQPPGAQVVIGDRALGETPVPLRFTPNLLFEVKAVKPGYQTVVRRFEPDNRAGQKLWFTLRKLPAPKKRGR